MTVDQIFQDRGVVREFPAPKRSLVSTAAQLRTKTFAPLKWVAPGYITEGMTLLAGRPKIGKSWLMLDCGLAVAAGRPWWDAAPCDGGDVLYLALEDNERRLQSRITKLIGYAEAWPSTFHFATEWPKAADGGLDRLVDWITSVAKPRLIVIDVIAMFRDTKDGATDPYAADYNAIKALQAIASEHRIAIVGVHHLRKSGAEVDPFEKVSGTMGLSGAADTVMILDRDSNGTSMYGRGRDAPEIEKAVEFDADLCQWRVLGDAATVHVSDTRGQIIDALRDAGGPMSPADLAAATGMPSGAVRQMLFRMATDGKVRKEGRGAYVMAGGYTQA